jgi:hypothetical protein
MRKTFLGFSLSFSPAPCGSTPPCLRISKTNHENKKTNNLLMFLFVYTEASSIALSLPLFPSQRGSASDTTSSDGNGSVFDRTKTPALCAI